MNTNLRTSSLEEEMTQEEKEKIEALIKEIVSSTSLINLEAELNRSMCDFVERMISERG